MKRGQTFRKERTFSINIYIEGSLGKDGMVVSYQCSNYLSTTVTRNRRILFLGCGFALWVPPGKLDLEFRWQHTRRSFITLLYLWVAKFMAHPESTLARIVHLYTVQICRTVNWLIAIFIGIDEIRVSSRKSHDHVQMQYLERNEPITLQSRLLHKKYCLLMQKTFRYPLAPIDNLPDISDKSLIHFNISFLSFALAFVN